MEKLQQRVMCQVAIVGLVLAIGTPSHATLLVSATDPALAGATVVPFDETIGLAVGLSTLTTTQGGVDVTLRTTMPQGLYDGNGRLPTYWPGGVTLEFVPPVGAVGFHYAGAECAGQVLVDGAAADESFQFPFGAANQFIGAANIGEISSVTLNGSCFAAWWNDMYFVSATTPPPTDEADLSLSKRALGPYTAGDTTSYEITVANHGPDTAQGVQAIDFLPQLSTLASSSLPTSVQPGLNPVVTVLLPDVPTGGEERPTIEVQPAAFGAGTYCNTALVNFAIATGTSLDLDPSNNDWTSVTPFDNASRASAPEICTNAFDDDCDGRPDCTDTECLSHPRCRPPTPPSTPDPLCWGGLVHIPGVGVADSCGNLIAQEAPETLPDSSGARSCRFPTRCTGVDLTMSLVCCDPPPNDTVEWLETASDCIQEAFSQLSSVPVECQIGREDTSGLTWMGMPVDPNYKEADPPVNVFGHGRTQAGQRIAYTLHYENIGTADAHDVVVLDALSPELDDSTLQVEDGGTYDPTTRVLRWLDPVVPPHTPRSVRFSIQVRSDAPLGTRVRNTGTIIFPDAVPPTRIDTNFVEHQIPIPEELPTVTPSVLGCRSLGSDAWRVRLANTGAGFGYGAMVEVLEAPAGMTVTDATAFFSHPTDTDPLRPTLAPASFTDSDDVIVLIGSGPNDPCPRLRWRVSWNDSTGQARSVEIPPASEGEICGNCLDDDGDGRIDVKDEECASDPLELRRGVLRLPTPEDRDRVVLRGSFEAPTAGFDPAATGATIQLYEGNELVACYPLPPGSGWRTNRRGTRWVFRDTRHDELADPEANEKLRLRVRRGRILVDARIKEVQLDDLTPGLYTAAITAGAKTFENESEWRARTASKRLVTP